MEPASHRGLMLILSSPSGAGKTTIARALVARNNNFKTSVSATTRPPRPNEKDGVDYHFVDDSHFQEMVTKGALLEHARVFKHYYGTPRQPVEDALAAGYDMLFDIDWQGAQQIKLSMRRDMVSVFVLPPSMAELEQRLKGRQSDSVDTITFRMQKALDEISHWGEYDYILVNRDLDESVRAVESILQAEKLRKSRQAALTTFVRDLGIEAEKLGY